MTGRRRRLAARPAQGYVPVILSANGNGDAATVTIATPAVPEAAHQPTEEIFPAPSLAQDLAGGLKAAVLGLADDLASYVREPVPDLYSADPADRTEWFLLAGGPEPLFEGTVRDLGAEWLLDTSLPVPPRTAPEPAEDTKDPGSGSAPPVDVAETSPASADPEPVTDGEPVQDEPDAEADCAEGSEA